MAGICVGELVIAAVTASTIRSHVTSVMTEHAIPDDHVLYAVAELSSLHPELATAIILALAISTAVGGALWTLLAPLLLLRLARGDDEDAPLGEPWIRRLPGALATTAWHLGLRVAFVLVAGSGLAALPPVAAAVLGFVVILVATVALDLSRVAVVLDQAHGISPRSAIEGFRRMAPQWRAATAMAAIAAAQWALAIVAVVVAVRTGGAGLAVARATAAAATCLGVFRLAIAAGTARGPTAPPAADA
jgi:hypothetical protein